MSKHIHIVGCAPRSGTTLLAELFRTSFDIDGYYEHERSVFKSDYRDYDILVSKSPVEVVYFPWLLYLNRDLWCIYLLRDPRDVIVSSHNNTPGTYFTNLRVWRTYHSAAKKAQYHKRFITVKYEDLVTRPDDVQNRLSRQMDFLSTRRKFSDFGSSTSVSADSDQALGGTRKISARSVGRWVHHLPRIKAQIRLHGDISQELIDLGYEKDDKWLELLQGIDPDPTPGQQPDFIPLTRRLRNRYRVFRKALHYAYLQLRTRMKTGLSS